MTLVHLTEHPEYSGRLLNAVIALMRAPSLLHRVVEMFHYQGDKNCGLKK